MRTGSCILYYYCKPSSSVAIRKAGIAVDEVRTTIEAALPVQGTEDDDLSAAVDAVKKHRLAFWDAMLWGAAQRAGVRHLLTEDLQDGLELAVVRGESAAHLLKLGRYAALSHAPHLLKSRHEPKLRGSGI
jgi:hypothetical protein